MPIPNIPLNACINETPPSFAFEEPPEIAEIITAKAAAAANLIISFFNVSVTDEPNSAHDFSPFFNIISNNSVNGLITLSKITFPVCIKLFCTFLTASSEEKPFNNSFVYLFPKPNFVKSIFILGAFDTVFSNNF